MKRLDKKAIDKLWEEYEKNDPRQHISWELFLVRKAEDNIIHWLIDNYSCAQKLIIIPGDELLKNLERKE